MSDELRRIKARLERVVEDLGAYLDRTDTEGEQPWTEERDRRERARRLRDPRWKVIGEFLYRIHEAGGRISKVQWLHMGLVEFGYKDMRGLNSFLRGKPPVLRSEGDDVVLTPRGEAAARFWWEHFGRQKAGEA